MKNNVNKISIVIPVYNEMESIEELNSNIITTFSNLNSKNNDFYEFEIIYVNDGSHDKSLNILNRLARNNDNITVIDFIRNYGQTAAMSAGFDQAKGDIIVPMDGDLQNDPDDIFNLVQKIKEGFDVVSGWRKDRKDKGMSRILPSKIANYLISKISGVQLHDYGCSLKAYKKDLIKDVNLYGEMHRFIPIYIAWQGGSVAEIVVKHNPRKYGETKYGINRTTKVIADILLLKYIENYSTNPIHLFGGLALANFFLSFVGIILMIYFKYWGNKSFIETPLPQVVVLLLLTGILALFMGFIAEILMRTYFETQHKKPYKIRNILKSSTN